MVDIKDDGEDINVNRRDSDEILFESEIIQTAFNKIKFFKSQTNDLLEKVDSTGLLEDFDDLDIEELGDDALNQVSMVVDEIYDVIDENVPFEYLPEVLQEYSKSSKRALLRDADYVRKAKRKLKRLDSDEELINKVKINLRIIELCDKAIDVNFENSDAYYIKGLALINLEKYEEGIEEFISAMALTEDNIDIRLEIANANRLNGDYADAISVYDSVLKVDEYSLEAIKGKAFTYFDWEKYDQCDELFEKANSSKPLDDESLKVWALCLNELERSDEAERLMKKVEKQ